MSWVGWMALWIAIATAMGGVFAPFGLRYHRARSGGATRASAAKRSFIGVSDINSARDASGGATIESVSVPNSPADAAGLIGGDVITSFDQQSIKTANDLRKLLAATPAGKAVEVVYTRDGEMKRTTLAPISGDENDKLKAAVEDRPEGEGYLGVDDSELERVTVSGTNSTGVRLGEVLRNHPAYIAGLRDGDVVIEFAGTPIRTPAELLARIKRAQPDSTIKVVLMRGTQRLELPVKMGKND